MANAIEWRQVGTAWQRWYNGSLHVGIVNAAYERRMKVTVDLPIEFQRVMQYPSGLTVTTPNQQGQLTFDSFHYELIPIQFSVAENNSTRKLDFLMYGCDVVVWRFIPQPRPVDH